MIKITFEQNNEKKENFIVHKLFIIILHLKSSGLSMYDYIYIEIFTFFIVI